MSSQIRRVHTAYMLCVPYEIQPTSLAFREDKLRNGSKEIFSLFALCCTNRPQDLSQEMGYNKTWLICDKHHNGTTAETLNLS